MINLFTAANSGRVLVVGDVILDRYVYGQTSRISPEAPVPVVRVETTEERPGGAANVALNVSSLGVRVELIGVTGNDTSADTLEMYLTKKNVQCRFVQEEGFPTITKLRVLSQHQQLIRLDYETDEATTAGESLLKLYQQALNGSSVVVLSDYAKGSLNNIESYIQSARQQGIKVLVDPKGKNFERYRYANLLTPNLKEFEAVVGVCNDEADLTQKGKALCESLEIDALLVTRGEQGMTLVRDDLHAPIHLAAQAHEVFDVTGAGDTVIAVLAAALASGYELAHAMQYANFSAGLVVEKLGTATVSVDELNHAVQPLRPVSSRIIQVNELAEKIAQWRGRGKKLVMTNGCFDLLHAGHVQYLQQARALGDCLIVAVNDDQSVNRLKGEGRPITRLEQRMTTLAGLAAVDWVVAFSEDTPEKLVKQLQPDILVKGGDYQPDEVAGADFVRQNGGEVVILPFQPGCSTTDMVKAIQNNHEDKK